MLSPFQKNIHRLPNEIQYIILSYTYSPQQKALLEDILDYSQTIDIIYDYMNEPDYLDNHILVSPEDEIQNELYNYIHYYLCDGSLEMVAKIFWKRYFMFCSIPIERIPKYKLVNFVYYPLTMQIRFIWGLLLPSERNEFLDFYEEEMFLYEDDEEEYEEDYDF
jgi:hypothetical protein